MVPLTKPVPLNAVLRFGAQGEVESSLVVPRTGQKAAVPVQKGLGKEP